MLTAAALIVSLIYAHKLVALGIAIAASGGLLFGVVTQVPQPIIPSTSPDQDTLLGQGVNLGEQYELLTGAADAVTGGQGAIGSSKPLCGKSFLNAGSASADTLATPAIGSPSSGGNDGLTLVIYNVSGQAHTVTTAANKINGNKHIITFAATVGATVRLVAFNGVWYTNPGAADAALS